MQLTESEATKLFLSETITQVDEEWPSVYKEVQKVLAVVLKNGRQLKIKNQEEAKMSLIFAIIALELQALKNVFPSNADRVYEKLLASFNQFPGGEEIAREKITLYQTKFYESVTIKHSNPLKELVSQLLADWFDWFEGELGRDRLAANPLIVDGASLIVKRFLGFWKAFQEITIITKG